MAFKKEVRAVLGGIVMASGVMMGNFAENKKDATEAANAQDAKMEMVWGDLVKEQEAGALGKQEVVDKMQPHMEELKKLESKETLELFKVIGAGIVGLGGIALLTKNSIGGVRREDDVDAPKAKANKLG